MSAAAEAVRRALDATDAHNVTVDARDVFVLCTDNPHATAVGLLGIAHGALRVGESDKKLQVPRDQLETILRAAAEAAKVGDTTE